MMIKIFSGIIKARFAPIPEPTKAKIIQGIPRRKLIKPFFFPHIPEGPLPYHLKV